MIRHVKTNFGVESTAWLKEVVKGEAFSWSGTLTDTSGEEATPVNISTWQITAKAEFYNGQYDRVGDPTRLIRDGDIDPVSIPVTVVNGAAGEFRVDFPANLYPNEVDGLSPTVPMALIWLSFDQQTNPSKITIRNGLLVFRRGIPV